MKAPVVLLLLLATAKGFASGVPADLPPPAVVEKALAAHPGVRAARAELRGAAAEASRLRAGEYEYGLRLATQRRSAGNGPDYTEWSAGLERGLRLGGKASLDAQIGELGRSEYEERLGEARHEAARELLDLWYASRKASLEARLWRQQVSLLEDQKRIVDTRVRRGDAARLDALQAQAALAQAQSSAVASEAREGIALAELRVRYPELPAPQDNSVSPVVPEGDELAWLDRTLAHNHELLAIRRALGKARLLARRSEAEGVPDPVLGLYLASEQGGAERILGLSLSLPLPGEGRGAQTRVRLAQAEVLAEQEAALIRQIKARVAGNWRLAVAEVETWQRLEEVALVAEKHADLARRALALGELGLSDTLLARRNALDSRLAAGQARLAANEAIARLLLDAHQLWPLADVDQPID
ncbi:MAG: TolC family protein [Pseudomonadota bacterium]